MTNPSAMQGRPASFERLRSLRTRKGRADLTMRLTGSRFWGAGGRRENPPLQDHTITLESDWGPTVAGFRDDGAIFHIGSPSQRRHSMRAEDATSLAWWILYQAYVVNWLGLRRWLWYKALHRSVADHYRRLG